VSSSLALLSSSTEDLETLLRAVHRGDVDCPLTPLGLACVGLQDASSPMLNHLRDLDDRAVKAVLVAVLAERRRLHP
jgi:hypothetical protein